MLSVESFKGFWHHQMMDLVFFDDSECKTTKGTSRVLCIPFGHHKPHKSRQSAYAASQSNCDLEAGKQLKHPFTIFIIIYTPLNYVSSLLNPISSL